MPDYRAHHLPPSPPAVGDTLTLTPDEAHHLVTVNRAPPGAPVTLFDGAGHQWHGELLTARKTHATLRVLAPQPVPPLPFHLTLAQALPKGPTMDAIVRKATEIGARHLVPLVTSRTQVHLSGDRSDRKIDKWRTAALEACKQCGNPWLPEIAPVQTFPAWLAAHPLPPSTLGVIASLHPGALSLRQAVTAAAPRLGPAPRHARCLIGPEGDFSPEEVAAAVAAGYQPVTLGPLVLRCETAACYALSVLSHELTAL